MTLCSTGALFVLQNHLELERVKFSLLWVAYVPLSSSFDEQDGRLVPRTYSFPPVCWFALIVDITFISVFCSKYVKWAFKNYCCGHLPQEHGLGLCLNRAAEFPLSSVCHSPFQPQQAAQAMCQGAIMHEQLIVVLWRTWWLQWAACGVPRDAPERWGCWETILSQRGRRWWCGSELFGCWLVQCFSVSIDLQCFVLLWALAWRRGICFSSIIALRTGLLSSEKDRSSDSENLKGFGL